MKTTYALQPMDHMMFADDTDAHPMCFYLRLGLTGRVDPERLQQATRNALGRHPLLRSHIVGDSTGARSGLRFVPVDDPDPFVSILPHGEPWPFPRGQRRINPHDEIGVRLFARECEGQTELLVQIHHAVSDAIGAFAFIGDLLAYYSKLHGTEVALAELDATQLDTRTGASTPEAGRKVRLPKLLSRILRYFQTRPAFIAAPFQDATSKREGYPQPDVTCFNIEPLQLNDLKTKARAANATVNDALLTALFLALGQWNRTQGVTRPLRIGMPINMRRGDCQQLPAANVVSMCFLDRPVAAFDDPMHLMRSIARETREIKTYDLGQAMLGLLRLLGVFRGGVQQLTKYRRFFPCLSTAVLSNVGDVATGWRLPRQSDGRFLAGNLLVDSLELLPPIRRGTRAAFGATTYNGTLRISMHYDSKILNGAAADALSKLYANGLCGLVRRLGLSQAAGSASGRYSAATTPAHYLANERTSSALDPSRLTKPIVETSL